MNKNNFNEYQAKKLLFILQVKSTLILLVFYIRSLTILGRLKREKRETKCQERTVL